LGDSATPERKINKNYNNAITWFWLRPRRLIYILSVTWIKTVPLSEATKQLIEAMEEQRQLYPKEYAEPVHPSPDGPSQIVASHSLIPEALRHAFSTFGALMSPDLPLQRRQHEMITTVVSVTNRCFY